MGYNFNSAVPQPIAKLYNIMNDIADYNKTNIIKREMLTKKCLSIIKNNSEYLKQNGLDIGQKAILNTSKYGWDEITKALVMAGVDVNSSNHILNSKLETPLSNAIERNNIGMVNYLLQKGAKAHLALRSAYNHNKDLFYKFIKSNVTANESAFQIAQAICYFSDETLNPDYVDFIKELIDNGANVNYKLGKDRTLLIEAVERSKSNIVNMLINAGAEVNAKCFPYQMTALNFAVQNNDKEMVDTLIKAGADVNCKNCYGVTVLQDAVAEVKNEHLYGNGWEVGHKEHQLYKSRKDIVYMLIDAGADASIINEDGRKIIDFAQDDFKEELERYLKNNNLKQKLQNNSNKEKEENTL